MTLWIEVTIPLAGWVAPFGNPGIDGRSHLPRAYRSVPRPSSPLDAKASTRCPSLPRPAPRTSRKAGSGEPFEARPAGSPAADGRFPRREPTKHTHADDAAGPHERTRRRPHVTRDATIRSQPPTPPGPAGPDDPHGAPRPPPMVDGRGRPAGNRLDPSPPRSDRPAAHPTRPARPDQPAAVAAGVGPARGGQRAAPPAAGRAAPRPPRRPRHG